MIEDRQIRRGGSSLTHGSRGRGAPIVTSSSPVASGLAGLSKALGILPKIDNGKAQERANQEASAAYNKAKHDSRDMTPKQKALHMEEARSKIASGEGRSLFNKFFTDENESVQIWDDMRGDSSFSKAHKAVRDYRANNLDLNPAQMRQGINDIIHENFLEASGISQRTGERFLAHTEKYIDKVDDNITEEFILKQKVRNRDEVTRHTAMSVDDSVVEIFGLDESDLLTMGSDLDAYTKVQNTLNQEDAVGTLAMHVNDHLKGQAQRLVGMNVMGKKEANDSKLKSAEEIATRYGRPDLLDELVSMKDKSGMSMAKANPQGVAEARKRVVDASERRKQTMRTTYTRAQSEYEKQAVTTLTSNMNELKNVAVTDPSVQNISAYSNAWNEASTSLEKQWKSKSISADAYNAQRKVLDSYFWTDKAKAFITVPSVEAEGKKRLELYRNSKSLSAMDYSWFETHAESLSPATTEEASEIHRKLSTEMTEKVRRQETRVARTLDREREMHLDETYLSIYSGLTQQQKIFMDPARPEIRQSKGVSMPDVLSKEEFTLAVEKQTNKDLKELFGDGAGPDLTTYNSMYALNEAQLAEEQIKKLEDWKSKIPETENTATTPDELPNLEGMEDLTKQADEIQRSVATIPKFVFEKEVLSEDEKKSITKEDAKKMKHLPSLVRDNITRRFPEFNSGADVAKAIEELIPGQKSLVRDILADYWQPHLDARFEEERESASILNQLGDRYKSHIAEETRKETERTQKLSDYEKHLEASKGLTGDKRLEAEIKYLESLPSTIGTRLQLRDLRRLKKK